ncbi:hypothetical protein OEZ86_009317 [Tetradesmus obliquus]|nr:hypothetical protein OEZ86_009317 [Tetradesmus obliquus]
MPSKEFMSRSKAAQRKQAASGYFCLLLLGFASSTSASTHATRTSTGSSRWAHIFKLAATAAANNTDAGGHTWSLVAQLPYAGYGTPATAPGGPWAAVGTHPLDAAVAECLLGAAPCRPLVDVSDRFAAVAYVSGPELKADVVFHNAPAAAAGRKWAEFVKVCTLSKLLVAIGTDGNSKAAVTVPDPSADQLANIAIRQPTGTLSLRVLVTTRNPGASYVWTLSRRGEQACPTSPKNLLESINPNYNALPLLTADVTGDGLVTAVSGLLDAEGSNKLAAVGGY